MLGSLLSSKSNELKALRQSPEHSPQAFAPAPLKDVSVASSSTRPSMERAVTAALSTPHDAVVAELHGRHPTPDPSANIATASPVPNLGAATSAPSLERSENRNATASPPAPGVRSGAASPVDAGSEPIYDPFSGALAGLMLPHVADPDREPRGDGGAQFDDTKDELWTHLSRIRELQNEIAGLHVQMEGVGLSEVRGAKRPPGPMGRVHSDTIGAIEEWEGPAEADEQRKAARDAEFTKLAETFEGRRVAIDGIMSKLDDLSKSLTTFHALPTPAMDFGNSRSNTKESRTALSQDSHDAMSKATSSAASPPLPHHDPVLADGPASYMPDSPVSSGDS